MHTIVVNGEPFVFGDAWGPHAFRRLAHQVTGEADHEAGKNPTNEQIQQLIQQSYDEKNKRGKKVVLRLSEKSFGFVAEDCCSVTDEVTVPVLKKDKWGGTYHSRKKIRGCQCGECNDTNIWNAYKFLREKARVSFNV
jgi:hypothetical protein